MIVMHGKAHRLAMARVISQSALPDFDAITLRTRWMRRSAMVKVPSFPGTWSPQEDVA